MDRFKMKNFEKRIKRAVDSNRPRILSASGDFREPRAIAEFMREAGYEEDGPLRQSQVTGAWFQWWHRAVSPERMSATRKGLIPIAPRT